MLKHFMMRAMGKLFCLMFDSKLSAATDKEQELSAELKAKFREFSRIGTENCLPSEKEWAENINRLHDLVLGEDPRCFLRWDVIKRTMLVENAPYVSKELHYLKSLDSWKTHWAPAITETPVGKPYLYWLYPASSENLIHNAYHVAQLQANTGLTVKDMDFVLEFGGGYGSLCRLFFNLGYKGKYVIYDFPAFSALQQYFLKSIGINVYPIESFSHEKSGVFCVSSVEQLSPIIKSVSENDKSMFVATWSISETPIEFRRSILDLASSLKAFLIAYQESFGEADNVAFFEDWTKSQKTVEWQNFEIAHLACSHYLFGKATHGN